MKKIISIFVFLLLFNIGFSQNFSIGIKTGLTKTFYSISNAGNYWQHANLWLPLNAGIDFKYNFKHNIFLNTGINYNYYTDQVKRRLINPSEIINDYIPFNPPYHLATRNLYSSISIPIYVGYKFNIYKKEKHNLYIKCAAGIDLNYIFDCIDGDDETEVFYNFDNITGKITIHEELINNRHLYRTYYDKNSFKHKFNVSLTPQIAFAYEIKSKFYIDLYAEYHAGLVNVIDANALVVLLPEYDPEKNTAKINTSESNITSKGSYFSTGIGIGWYINTKKTRK